MSFDLDRSLRRLKPGRQTIPLGRRPDDALPFVPENATGGPGLLLDTCVYIDILQRRVPETLENFMAVRLCNHSGVALAELTHLFGRLDPKDGRTRTALTELSGVIHDMPEHRLTAPSTRALGESGILAGLAARLAGVESGHGQALLNDATLYLQAMEQGQIVLTRNIREFDWFDQLLPNNRILFYRRIQ